MNDVYNQLLAKWCLSSRSLVGKTIKHPGLGNLTVVDIVDKTIKVTSPRSKSTGNISHDFFIEDFTKLCYPKDINEWEIKILKEEKEKEIDRLNQLEQKRKEDEEIKLKQYLELEAARKRLLKVKDYIDLVLDILNNSIAKKVDIISPCPTSDDLKLVKLWMADEHNTSDGNERRLLSARLAETAMSKFYRQERYTVEDISISQINPSNNNWKSYDLLVEGQPVDIKNARQSQYNHERYVNHCITRFKENRNLESVTIAGVLSPWLPLSEMQSGNRSVLYLGTTTKVYINNLISEFEHGPLKICFQNTSSNNNNFLPPWLFKYSSNLYKNYDDLVFKLKKMPYPDWRLCYEAKINPLPAYIVSGLEYNFDPQLPLSISQKEFVKKFQLRKTKIGLTLATVFLSILEDFLIQLSSKSNRPYSPNDYRILVYPTTDLTRPLFLYDPLKTVNSLIECLSILWSKKTTELNNFHVFELQGFNILRGKINRSDPQWTTLIAYCGGWVTTLSGTKPCANIPLVFGKDKTCGVCGKLICPRCNFCSSTCHPQIENLSSF